MNGFGPFEPDRDGQADAPAARRREARQGLLLVLLLGLATVTVALSTGVATAGSPEIPFLRFLGR